MLTQKQMIPIFLFLFGAAVTGVVLGGIVVGNTIPIPPMQIVLIAIANLSLFVLGLGVILWSQTKEPQQSVDQRSRRTLIQVREEYPRARVAKRESNPGFSMRDRSKTDQAHAMSAQTATDERG